MGFVSEFLGDVKMYAWYIFAAAVAFVVIVIYIVVFRHG